MTSFRAFCPNDLLKYNLVNLDPLTATYDIGYYLNYILTWPDYNYSMIAPDGTIMGYVLGKAEGPRGMSEPEARLKKKWHGHVTAVTVMPEYRKLGGGVALMKILEDVTESIYGGYFVDLFVRESNSAVQWYKNQGYSVYRRVLDYYQDPGGALENALDMRKSMLKIDPTKETETPLGRDIIWNEVDSTL